MADPLREQLPRCLQDTDFPALGEKYRGKVRDTYRKADRLTLITTDRLSAFDHILTTIPFKGEILNRLTNFWFEKTKHVVKNHVIEVPDPNVMVGKRCEPFSVEFVVRGYITGSGWKEYKSNGKVCGHVLPEGLVESDQLPEPILTPATKATTGHDENITEDEARAIAGADIYDTAAHYALQLYKKAAEMALERGIIIADTKFEFGVFDDEVILIDEVLTPDSSRFWPQDRYERGRSQPSFDKQYVRDYLDTLDWNKTPPAPRLPVDVIQKTSEKYREALQRLTGRKLA